MHGCAQCGSEHPGFAGADKFPSVQGSQPATERQAQSGMASGSNTSTVATPERLGKMRDLIWRQGWCRIGYTERPIGTVLLAYHGYRGSIRCVRNSVVEQVAQDQPEMIGVSNNLMRRNLQGIW